MESFNGYAQIVEGMLSQRGPEGRAAAVAAASYLATVPLTDQTAPLFFRLLETGVDEAADRLLGRRSPDSFFSVLTPSRFLISKAFEILTDRAPGALYEPVLLSLLGVLQAAYVHARSGFGIIEPSISDLHHIGKHLIACSEEAADIVVSLMESWAGGRPGDVPVMAGQILDAWLDKSKGIDKVIPGVLLVKHHPESE